MYGEVFWYIVKLAYIVGNWIVMLSKAKSHSKRLFEKYAFIAFRFCTPVYVNITKIWVIHKQSQSFSCLYTSEFVFKRDSKWK